MESREELLVSFYATTKLRRTEEHKRYFKKDLPNRNSIAVISNF